ncbi:Ion channel [Teladorsagia circumcincta]|uniref:Ion channel n=1 Tax=Teladorsagia circumcincta TaxID=45464 RepID=A0A2G9V417_TELCI|nr:Ion channel [Teladorsagia circumcincta]
MLLQGYGNIVPATSSGRIACVVFALFGAPLAIITIGAFISLTTIGFGDIVPENHDYIVLMLAYLGIGLAVTTMCIDLVGIQYIQKIHYFGRKFRGTDLLHLLKRKRMIERRLAMGQGEEILQMYIQQMQNQLPEPIVVEQQWEEDKASSHIEMLKRRYESRGESWDESGPSISEHCSLSTEPSVHIRQEYWDKYQSPTASLSSFDYEVQLPSPDYQKIALSARRSRRLRSCPSGITVPPSQSVSNRSVPVSARCQPRYCTPSDPLMLSAPLSFRISEPFMLSKLAVQCDSPPPPHSATIDFEVAPVAASFVPNSEVPELELFYPKYCLPNASVHEPQTDIPRLQLNESPPSTSRLSSRFYSTLFTISERRLSHVRDPRAATDASDDGDVAEHYRTDEALRKTTQPTRQTPTTPRLPTPVTPPADPQFSGYALPSTSRVSTPPREPSPPRVHAPIKSPTPPRIVTPVFVEVLTEIEVVPEEHELVIEPDETEDMQSPVPTDSSSEEENGNGMDLDLGAFELVDSGMTAETLLSTEEPVIYHRDLPVHSVHHDTVQTEAALANLMSAPSSMLTGAIPPTMVEDNYCFVVDGERVRMGDILGDDQWWRHTSRPTKYFYSEDLRQFHRVNCIAVKGKVITAKLATSVLQVQATATGVASSASTPRSSVSGASARSHGRDNKVPLAHVYKVIRFYSFWKTCTSFHRIVTMIDRVTDDRNVNPDFKKRLFVQYLWRNAKAVEKARVQKEFDPRRQRLLRFVTDPTTRKRFQKM